MATRQAFQKNLRDADLRVTRALPGAASTTVTSTPIDLGAISADGARDVNAELVGKVAALNTTQLPDTRTVTLTIEASDDSAFGSGVDVLGTKVVTGAGGVGAAASELRAGCRELHCARYARLKSVTGVIDRRPVGGGRRVLRGDLNDEDNFLRAVRGFKGRCKLGSADQGRRTLIRI
jgi:hypothetical protein